MRRPFADMFEGKQKLTPVKRCVGFFRSLLVFDSLLNVCWALIPEFFGNNRLDFAADPLFVWFLAQRLLAPHSFELVFEQPLKQFKSFKPSPDLMSFNIRLTFVEPDL
jgi:hypothetical protein